MKALSDTAVQILELESTIRTNPTRLARLGINLAHDLRDAFPLDVGYDDELEADEEVPGLFRSVRIAREEEEEEEEGEDGRR
jgi:hypothetical protein